ncbi:MAG: HAMP domain-containing methyl-accepting chemotaxis protein [Pseudomonadota bacterium]
MTRLAKFFGSVLVRFALIMGIFASIVFVVVSISLSVFQSTQESLTTLSEQRVEELIQGDVVAAQTDSLREALPNLLMSRSVDEVNTVFAQISQSIAAANSASEQLPGSEAAQILEILESADLSLSELAVARIAEFRTQNEITTLLKQANDLASEASRVLETSADDAYFDVVIGSEETRGTINTMFSKLVYEDVTLLQSTLEAIGKFDLLAGTALAIAETDDRGLATILQDIAAAADGRLDDLIPELSANEQTASAAEELANAKSSIMEALQAPRAQDVATKVLADRQSTGASLSAALDDLTFSLVLSSDETLTESDTELRKLLEGDIALIQDRAALDRATRDVVTAAFNVALSKDTTELSLAAEQLNSKSGSLRELIDGEEINLKASLTAIADLALPETGISDVQRRVFSSRQDVETAASNAAKAVQEITLGVVEMKKRATDTIKETAQSLTSQAGQANERLQFIAFVSVAVFGSAMFILWLIIIRPLGRITTTTERLASGDLSELHGLSRAGEMGRLATALQKFRDAALEQIRLQKEKEATEAAAREKERRAEEERRAAEKREQEAELKRVHEDRLREEKEAEREKKIRDANEAERRARSEEQEKVVASLATGLKKLADGDLTGHIDDVFPGSYEELRKDYNSAVKNLTAVISELRSAAERIDGSANEIASATDGLSRRAEGNAATLEQTAAAINELTAAVSSSAMNAGQANTTAISAHGGAETGRQVMQHAVDSMGEIKGSSDQIEKIITVIEDIAFQTNLLALNAGVEAARAGSAGQGFAVVASEVRALAQRSSEAAQEISDLITESNVQVGDGVNRVEEARVSLEAILKDVDQVTAQISEISVSAEQQKVTVTEINAAVMQLDSSTQSNAAQFEETTSATQVLSEEAKQLSSLVRRFSVEAGSARSENSTSQARASTAAA